MNAPAARFHCPRCDRDTRDPWCCGLDQGAARPFEMTREHIRTIHVVKARKGLDQETYKLRLQAVGVTSYKAMTREQYRAFLRGLGSLPDAPRRTIERSTKTGNRNGY